MVVAAVGAAAAIGGAVISSSSAKKASKEATAAQTGAANKQLNFEKEQSDRQFALQQDMFSYQSGMQRPWLNVGATALSAYSKELGLQLPESAYSLPDQLGAGGQSIAQGPAQTALWGDIQEERALAEKVTAGLPRSKFGGSAFGDAYLETQPNIQVPDWVSDPSASGQAPTAGTPAQSYDPSQGVSTGFEATPFYQFQQDEMQKAVQGSAAAGGSLRSGQTMKALQDRSQNLASSEYNNYLNRLQGLATGGQTAGTAIGNYGSSLAGTNAFSNLAGTNAFGAIGNAQVGGILGQNAANQQMIGTVAGAFGQGGALNNIFSGQGQSQPVQGMTPPIQPSVIPQGSILGGNSEFL